MPETAKPQPAQAQITVNVPPRIKHGAASHFAFDEVYQGGDGSSPKAKILSVPTIRDLTRKFIFPYVFVAAANDGANHFIGCTIRAMLGSETVQSFPLEAGQLYDATGGAGRSLVSFGGSSTASPSIVLTQTPRLLFENCPSVVAGIELNLECDRFSVDLDRLYSATQYRIFLAVLAMRPETYE